MAENYVLLETIQLTQSAASVTFDNIPQSGYTDLKMVMSARSDGADWDSVSIRFNNDSNSGRYTSRALRGNGSTVISFVGGNTTASYISEGNGTNSTSNTFTNSEVYIPNYTASIQKSISVDAVGENNATAGYQVLSAGLYNQTTSISSITLQWGSGYNFVSGSTFSLYGVAAVGTTPTVAPKATGGNIVANDGTYWYHAFLTSGNFVPQTALTCNYLVVAGGGGGGYNQAGGGGAGGLRSTVTATGGGGSLESAISVTTQSYAITVGAGGAGGATSGTQGTNGSNSIFSTITSTGGGGGGAGNTANNAGLTGGSGGGGGNPSNGTSTAGSGTTNQGYAGGTGSSDNLSYRTGGGGGGAGAAGTNGATANPPNTGGNGGNGVAISAFATPTSTGVSNFYAGGGAGGAGGGAGTGGSGGGGSNSSGVAGTGGGGSGPFGGGAGYQGGSGIVIIRYAMV